MKRLALMVLLLAGSAHADHGNRIIYPSSDSRPAALYITEQVELQGYQGVTVVSIACTDRKQPETCAGNWYGDDSKGRRVSGRWNLDGTIDITNSWTWPWQEKRE